MLSGEGHITWENIFYAAVRFQLIHFKFQLDITETVTLAHAWPAKCRYHNIYIFAFGPNTFT